MQSNESSLAYQSFPPDYVINTKWMLEGLLLPIVGIIGIVGKAWVPNITWIKHRVMVLDFILSSVGEVKIDTKVASSDKSSDLAVELNLEN